MLTADSATSSVWALRHRRRLLRVPEQITKCVAFLAAKHPSESNYHYAGTAFFIGVDSPTYPETRSYVFMVTAAHVVRGITASGARIYLRTNMTDGTSLVIDVTDGPWFFPENEAADVAITSFVFKPPEAFDIVIFPSGGFATKDKLENFEIGIGDELYISGLFVKHTGKERNLPIVRT